MYKHNGEWSELTHFQALNVVSSTSQRDIDVFRHLFFGNSMTFEAIRGRSMSVKQMHYIRFRYSKACLNKAI